MKRKIKSQIDKRYSHKIYDTDRAVTLVREIQKELKLREIVQLLKLTPIKFAFFDINQEMYWVESEEDTQTFWELRVKPNLCKAVNPKLINKLRKKNKSACIDFDWCYFASLWEAENLDKIIVLFMAH